jgi:hypothetical protein
MSDTLNPLGMRKLLILLFGTLVGLPGISQTQLGEISRVWKTKRVTVADGFTYRYRLWDGYDTAIYYQTGADTFEVVTTFKKVTSTKPPVLPDIISTLDDNAVSPGQVYNPATNAGDNIYIPATGWSHFKGQTWNENHLNKTASVVDLAGGFIEITCTCYRVDWYAEKRENHGIASVSIDGGAAKDADLYEARTDNNSTQVWTSPPGMTNATHKIRVSYTGRKNAAATQTNLVHDYFKIYTKQ